MHFWPKTKMVRHLEIQVDIQARKLYLDVFLRFWTPGERSREMETGVLLRIYPKRINSFLQRSQKWVGPQNIELLLIFISQN